MTQFIGIERPQKVMCIFGGFGGVGLGAQQAKAHYRGLMARGEVIGSVDVDARSCEDFEMWTGVKATQMDLFDAEQYTDWHGKPPGPDWREAGSDEIRAAAQWQDPDVVIITAPCKGFSGLLGQDKAKSQKYQALNKLTFRGVFLTMEAWKHNPPSFILFENVKGLANRGERFLKSIKGLLGHYGYVFHDEHYDCGVIGNLAQHRKRFLLVARNPAKVPNYLYNPPRRRVRAIGEVLEQLPLPINPDASLADMDAAGGEMHRLPRLSWKTWVRLALISPGGDWRDLQKVQPGEYTIQPVPWAPKTFEIVKTADLYGSGAAAVADTRLGHTPMGGGKGSFWVQDTSDPSGTITGDPSHRKSGGASCIADPGLVSSQRDGAMQVGDMSESAGPVIGAAAVTSSNGIGAVADPRLSEHGCNFAGSPGLMGVLDNSEPSNAITGSASVSSSNCPAAMADHRYTREPRSGVYAVNDMADPGRTVTQGKDPNGQMLSVADPRQAEGTFKNYLRVNDSGEPSNTVTGSAGPNQGANLVADPRFTCGARKGTMQVQDSDDPSMAVIGNSSVYSGAAAVADPNPVKQTSQGIWDCRIPGDDERGVWYIISPHKDKKGRHCVHRPLTTLELMALQSFPVRWNGKSVVLAGKSDRSWRERIGNAMPPDAVSAILGQMFLSILASETGDYLMDLAQSGTWVNPVEPEVVTRQ